MSFLFIRLSAGFSISLCVLLLLFYFLQLHLQHLHMHAEHLETVFTVPFGTSLRYRQNLVFAPNTKHIIVVTTLCLSLLPALQKADDQRRHLHFLRWHRLADRTSRWQKQGSRMAELRKLRSRWWGTNTWGRHRC